MKIERLNDRLLTASIHLNTVYDGSYRPLSRVWVVGDISGDGADDLVALFSNSQYVFEASWNGSEFEASERYDVINDRLDKGLPARPSGPGKDDGFDDFNGDGIEDSIRRIGGRHGQDDFWVDFSTPEPERIMGDANGSGRVDFADFLRLSANFGKVDAVFADGDFDGNGTVEFADFLILSEHFNG